MGQCQGAQAQRQPNQLSANEIATNSSGVTSPPSYTEATSPSKKQKTAEHGGALSVTHRLGREKALRGIKQQTHALITITTPPVERDQAAAPLHVCCVMDKSGSMGSAGKLSSAKKAVRKLIKHLSSADALSLVEYDSNASTAFSILPGALTESVKEECTQTVREIQAGSMTNLMAGLETAASILQGLPGPASAKRIFLFSDGLVNQGETDSRKIVARVAELASQGITTASFGIGRDFDEQLMTGIAECGNGQYFYLESAEVIPKLVSKSVHGLVSLYGTQAKLTVRGLEGCVVTRLFGSEDDHDLLHGFDLGDLHADNTRQVLLQLEVSPGSAQSSKVLHYKVEFTDSNGTDQYVEGAAAMSFVDNDAELPAEDCEVLCARAIQESTDIDDQVGELLSKGNQDQAIEVKRKSVRQLEEALTQLEGANHERLTRMLERGTRTLEHMETRSDMHEMRLELQYEQCLQRRMSDDGMDLRRECDSDDGCWSDEAECKAISPRALRRRGSTPRGLQRYDSDGSDDDDDFYN